MSALKSQEHRVTAEEYFRHRQRFEGKYELHDGAIIAMAGGTPSHTRLGGMADRSIFNLIEPNGCEAFDCDQSIAIEAFGNYYFPDASATCDKADFDAENNLTNPMMIVEVLSRSTALFDRNTKFERYKTIPTLEYYLLIWQNKPRLQLFTRPQNNGGDDWIETVIEGLDAELNLPFFIEPLSLSTLYRYVTFDEQA